MSSLQADLATVVGAAHVLGANRMADLDPGIDADNLGGDLLIRPADAAEAAAALAICAAAGVGVVTHGGRTGLSGGARSRAGEVVLSTERMAGPIEIDPAERVAVVGAGVTLQALQEAAAEHGLAPGIDIAARGSATIGGMISTNAGGMEAWRNGMMRDRLLGMEVALANGEVLSDLTRVKKANEGYDLKQVFCGAEGTLGVVTRAVLRLESAPRRGVTVLTAQAHAAGAIEIMRALQDQGRLMLAEAMWRDLAQANADCLGLSHLTAFQDAPLYVLYEIGGDEDAALAALQPFIKTGAIQNALIAQSERERAEIWRLREDSQPLQRVYQAALWFDISVPLSGLDRYVDGLKARIGALGYADALHILGHLGDGNLHITVAADSFDDARKTEVALAVEEGLKAAGGAVSAEHGVGEDKLPTALRARSAGTAAAMRALKAAFDPEGVLNAGKVV